MPLVLSLWDMSRVITLPIPGRCAIGEHAFGAGFMLALCHDVRLMREDRGFLCANEVAVECHSGPRDGTLQACSVEHVLQNHSVGPSLEWR